MKRNLLILALGEISTGELVMAIEFAKDLPSKEYDITFVIPKNKERIFPCEEPWEVHMLSQSLPPDSNYDFIIELFSVKKFDLVVLFDVYTFEYAQKWTGINLDKLKRFQVPIASLDEYEYTKSDYKLDYYGLMVKKLPNLLQEIDFVLKNCPLSMPKKSSYQKENEFYYQVISKPDRPNQDLDFVYKWKLAGEKLVFFTLSEWEVNKSYTFYHHKLFMDYLFPLIYEYVRSLEMPIHLIHIGPNIWEYQSRGVLRYTHIPSLPISEFENLLAISDLYITYNLVSITLTKAIEYDIPSLVLNNDKVIDFRKLSNKLKEKPIWYQNMAEKLQIVYPFSASTFGWF